MCLCMCLCHFVYMCTCVCVGAFVIIFCWITDHITLAPYHIMQTCRQCPRRTIQPSITQFIPAMSNTCFSTILFSFSPFTKLHRFYTKIKLLSYDNTNRLRRAFPGNTNPEVNGSARACEGTILTEGLVYPG